MIVSPRVLLGFVVGLIGLIGLFLAAGAEDGAFYDAGLLVAVVAYLFVLFLIKQGYDESDKKN